jgi:hypothetical protein
MEPKQSQLSADERKLLDGLESHPELMSRFLSILSLAQEPTSDGVIRSANEVESLLVGEVRQLGREGMQSWARQVDANAGKQCRREDASVQLREKKL